MDKASGIDFLKRLAHILAFQFGSDCEVVVHELSQKNHKSRIVAIENGHVSGRKKGDGPSRIVLEALRGGKDLADRDAYYTKTADGRMLRSTSTFLKDASGNTIGILSINYDLSKLLLTEQILHGLTNLPVQDQSAATAIPQNVNDLLDQLLEQSVALVGKPVPLMTKEDKVRAVHFLNDAGAFLITRSGDKVSKFFGISKYTLYTYFDAKETKENAQN